MHRHSIAALASCVLSAGCDPFGTQSHAGTAFQVTANLTQDTCGPQAIPVLHTAVFHVEMSSQNSHISWRVRENGASASGTLSAATQTFQFADDSQFQRRPVDRVNERAACILRRLDVVAGTLSAPLPSPDAGGGSNSNDAGLDVSTDAGDSSADAGDSSTDAAGLSFTATETIVYGTIAGADCSDQVGASDGQFLALPCQQVFELRGVAQNNP